MKGRGNKTERYYNLARVFKPSGKILKFRWLEICHPQLKMNTLLFVRASVKYLQHVVINGFKVNCRRWPIICGIVRDAIS